MNSPSPPVNTCSSNSQMAAPQSEAHRALLATAFAVVLALVFSFYYLTHTVVTKEANPRLLADFVGNRPYQARILVPFLAHWGARLTALDVVTCYQLILPGFVLGSFVVFGAYLRQFCPPRAARWLALSLVWPLFAFYSHKWFYPYDVPAVFFATLGLLLMAQGRFTLYLVAFTLATLNRETSAFIALAFVLTQWKTLPRRQFASVLAAQMGIWLALRTVMALLFASNAGKTVEWHWGDNVTSARHLLESPWPLALRSAILTFAVLWGLGAATRRFQPEFLWRARGVVVPFLILMSVVGVLTETRLYSELIPILLAPALVGTFNGLSQRLA